MAVADDVQREVINDFATTGNYRQTGERFGLHNEVVRRIIKSPQGSFALEQTLRERARTRALRLGAMTDRMIDEVATILDRGDERILNGRRDGEPLTVFIRPGLRDVISGLAWITHHMEQIHESLSTIDVTSHDVSHEARSQNLATLKELVSQEERRLSLTGEAAAEHLDHAGTGGPAVATGDATAWQRGSFGNAHSSPAAQQYNLRDALNVHRHRKPNARQLAAIAEPLTIPTAGGTGQQGISHVDAVASLLPCAPLPASSEPDVKHRGGGTIPSDSTERQPQEVGSLIENPQCFRGPGAPVAQSPTPPTQPRETNPPNFSASGESDVVDWDDLKED